MDRQSTPIGVHTVLMDDSEENEVPSKGVEPMSKEEILEQINLIDQKNSSPSAPRRRGGS